MEFLRQWVLINKIFGPNEIIVFCKYNKMTGHQKFIVLLRKYNL